MTDTAIPPAPDAPATAPPATNPLAQPGTVHTTREIEALIPHRWPFLLVEGVVTNVAIHKALLASETFLDGKMTTNLLDRVGPAAILAGAAPV